MSQYMLLCANWAQTWQSPHLPVHGELDRTHLSNSPSAEPLLGGHSTNPNASPCYATISLDITLLDQKQLMLIQKLDF